MIIYDPYECLVRQLIEMRKAQLYRCVVDGEDSFRGERLPIGTQDQILAWLNERYRVVGELYFGSRDRFICLCGYWGWRPPELRYLVVVQGACAREMWHNVRKEFVMHRELPEIVQRQAIDSCRDRVS